MAKGKSILLTLIVMALWGSLFPVVKLGYNAYQVVTFADIILFAGVRFTIAGGIICIITCVKNRASVKEVKGSIIPILLSGLFGVILHYGFTYSALSLTASSKTAIIKQIGALLYVCFSFLFFKNEKPSTVKIIGASIGFLGIIAINIGEEGGFQFGVGDLLILSASLCTVFSNVSGKIAMKRVNSITMTGVSQLFGGVVLLIVGICLGGKINLFNERWYIFAYICTASVISYCLWFFVARRGDLSKLFIIKFAEPIFACVFAWIILGEEILKWQYLISFLLVAVGIVLSNLNLSSKGKKIKA